jgi:hypothetical protein
MKIEEIVGNDEEKATQKIKAYNEETHPRCH